MQTMFVSLPSSILSTSQPPSPGRSHYPCAAKPLSPLHTNVFAASTSSLGGPQTPTQTRGSPLNKHFRDAMQSSASMASLMGSFARTIVPTAAVTTPDVDFGLVSANSPDESLLTGSPQQRPRVCLPRSKFGTQRGKHRSQPPSPTRGLDTDTNSQKTELLTMDSNANARNRASFKPQRAHKGSNAWQLKQFAEATLGNGSLKKVVKLPEGEDRDEWLAVNSE